MSSKKLINLVTSNLESALHLDTIKVCHALHLDTIKVRHDTKPSHGLRSNVIIYLYSIIFSPNVHKNLPERSNV